MWEWLVKGSRVVILDIPLLFESRLDRFCGITVVVCSQKDVQLQRLLERDPQLSDEDARGRVASQLDIEEKKTLGDVVIENDSTKEDLEKRVAQVVKQYFTRSGFWTWFLRIPHVGLTLALLIFIRRSWSRKKKRS
jgi:dephospho-CoA kinase